MRQRRLLIDWIYYPAVGHAIEAFRLADEFKHVDPELFVGVLLNAHAPVELAPCVAAVDECHGVEFGMPFDDLEEPLDLAHVPRDWDSVVRGHDYPSGWPALDRVRSLVKTHLRSPHPDADWNAPFLPRRRPRGLGLALPADAKRFAEDWIDPGRAPWISVLPAAGGYRKSPSVEFWARVLNGIAKRHPGAGFLLLGSRDRSRFTTQGYPPERVAELTSRVPGARDAFDLGLLNQLALAERCALHLSPHSGMSFAVQAVGVPWLVVSAHRYPEYLLNDVPFHSILPECPLYPCHGRELEECRELERRSEPVLCLRDEALLPKVDEVVDAADRLLRGAIPFEEAAAQHLRVLRERMGLAEDESPLYGWGVPSVAPG